MYFYAKNHVNVCKFCARNQLKTRSFWLFVQNCYRNSTVRFVLFNVHYPSFQFHHYNKKAKILSLNFVFSYVFINFAPII